MKREDVKFYILIGVAVVTLINTVMILNIKTAPTLGAPTTSKTSDVAQSQQNIVADNSMNMNQNMNQPIETTINPVNNNPAPNQPTGPMASIKFQKYEHDFGTVKALTNNKYKFVFTNTGDVPLTIENASASCGCTVPNWPKEPIMPNKTGEIDVEFSPKENQLGVQEKTVTITANIPERQALLKIKANVIE